MGEQDADRAAVDLVGDVHDRSRRRACRVRGCDRDVGATHADDGWVALPRRLMTDIGPWPASVIAASVVVPFAYISIASFPTGRYYFPMLPALYATAGLGVAVATPAGRCDRDGASVSSPHRSPRSASRWQSCGASASSTACTGTRTRASRPRSGSLGTCRQAACCRRRRGTTGCRSGCPVSMPSNSPASSSTWSAPTTRPRSPRIAQQLGRIDYVVESSARIWGTVTRMPEPVPIDDQLLRRVGYRCAGVRAGGDVPQRHLPRAVAAGRRERRGSLQRVRPSAGPDLAQGSRRRSRHDRRSPRSGRCRERSRRRSDQSEHERPPADRRRDRDQRDRPDLRPGIRHRRLEPSACDRLVRAAGAAGLRRVRDVRSACCGACPTPGGDWPRSLRSGPWRSRCSSPRHGCTSISTARRPVSSRLRSSEPERSARSGDARSCRICGASGEPVLIAVEVLVHGDLRRVRVDPGDGSRPVAPGPRRREAVRVGAVDGGAAYQDAARVRPVVLARCAELLLRRLVPAVSTGPGSAHVADDGHERRHRRLRQHLGRGGVLTRLPGWSMRPAPVGAGIRAPSAPASRPVCWPQSSCCSSATVRS